MDEEQKTDYLTPDTNLIPGQRYALISVVSPDSTQKHKECAVKIKAVFESEEEAHHYAKKLQKTEQLFDVFMVEMGKWLPIPPNKDLIESQEYQDDLLNDIIKSHAEEKVKANQFFEQHKMESMTSTASTSNNN